MGEAPDVTNRKLGVPVFQEVLQIVYSRPFDCHANPQRQERASGCT
jgi:hypothetical protein